jgi:hypothetical protein
VQIFTLNSPQSNNQIFEVKSQDSESSEWLFFRFSLRPATNVQRDFAFSELMAIGCPLQPGAMRGDNRPEVESLPAMQERIVKAAELK